MSARLPSSRPMPGSFNPGKIPSLYGSYSLTVRGCPQAAGRSTAMTTSGTGRRMLGLGCGQPHGSAEILLKAALRAAENQGAEVELVRLDELRLPSGAAETAEPDDGWWLWERLVECDGLIVSTPIISRTVAARLKLFID